MVTAIILAMQEAEIRRIMVGQKVRETLISINKLGILAHTIIPVLQQT
jgi:hypothetical protein